MSDTIYWNVEHLNSFFGMQNCLKQIELSQKELDSVSYSVSDYFGQGNPFYGKKTHRRI